MDKIRLATEEEIKEIEAGSNLTAMSRVLVLGKMKAVWKICNELDPVYFDGAPKPLMYKFLWGLENLMKGSGVTEYYFNIPAADTQYQEVIEHLGGERQSKQPDYRYKINL